MECVCVCVCVCFSWVWSVVCRAVRWTWWQVVWLRVYSLVAVVILFYFWTRKAGPKNYSVTYFFVVVVVSSLKIPKSFLIRRAVQWNYLSAPPVSERSHLRSPSDTDTARRLKFINNNLPVELRQWDICLREFRRLLKMFLFCWDSAPCDFLFKCTMYKYTYLLTYIHPDIAHRSTGLDFQLS